MLRELFKARRFALLVFIFKLALFHLPANAAPHETRENADLQAGDILLVPLNCYVCNAIEKETGVPYSHSVVVATTTNDLNNAFVYEAWGKVKRTPLSEILSRAQKGQDLLHMRSTEFHSTTPSEQELASIFNIRFEDLPFDDLFLWNNFDEATGKEKLYCSEFVLKFVNTFLRDPEPSVPMSFGTLQDFWTGYYKQFNHEVPEGEPGVSPATLFHSSRFVKLGPLKTPLKN